MLRWSCFPSSPLLPAPAPSAGVREPPAGQGEVTSARSKQGRAKEGGMSAPRGQKGNVGSKEVSCQPAPAVCVWALGLAGGREGRTWNCSDQAPISLRSHRNCTARNHATVTHEKGLIKSCALMEKCDLIFQEHYPPSFCLPACMKKSKSLWIEGQR